MSTIAQPVKDVSKEYMVRFRVDEALWERLQIFCVKKRTTMQAVGTEAIVDYLTAAKKQEPRNVR